MVGAETVQRLLSSCPDSLAALLLGGVSAKRPILKLTRRFVSRIPLGMSDQRHKDPLHGVTLKAIVTDLAERLGWEELADLVRIRCFQENPSIKSSLTFLRKTEWARRKVEDLWLLEQGHPIPKRSPLPETEERDAGRQSVRGPRKVAKTERPKINPWTGKPYGEESF